MATPSALLLCMFSISSLSQPSFAGYTTGFRLKLIHRNSLPFYSPNATKYDRAMLAIDRSFARLNHFHSILTGKSLSRRSSPSKLRSTVTILKYQMIMDTGSDVVWMQCLPCPQCFQQSAPIFDPTKSSTYQKLECSSPLCKGTNTHCDAGCSYKATYEDGSSTIGTFSSETFTFEETKTSAMTNTSDITSISPRIGMGTGESTSIQGIGFGCGHQNTMSHNGGAGIVGLGGGPLSLISQLGSSVNNKFSYCLSSSGTSMLNFDAHAEVPDATAKSTPIFRLPNNPTFHILHLKDVMVGSTSVGIPPGTFDPTVSGKGFIIDSGTTMILLAQVAYDKVVGKLREAITLPKADIPFQTLELCYTVNSPGDLTGVPEVTFQFSGNADWKLGPDNLFLEIQKGQVCVAMAASNSLSVFGNLAQRNMIVEYDLGMEKLFFAPANCNAV
ncbi:hypothetical protein AMTRI_Chr02g264540 [Amborella trichopoda]